MSSQDQNAPSEKFVQSVRPNSKPFGRTPDTVMSDAKKPQNSDVDGQSRGDSATPLIRGASYRNESGQLVTVKECASCGEKYTTIKPHSRYCSTACRMRAYRARKRDDGAGLAMLLAMFIPLLMLACGELTLEGQGRIAAVETVPPEEPISFVGLPENQDVVRTEIGSIDDFGQIYWRTLFRCGDNWQLTHEAKEPVTPLVYHRYIESIHSWHDQSTGTMHSVAAFRHHSIAFDCPQQGGGTP